MMNNDLKWGELKATLRFIEEKILRFTEINGWWSTKNLYEQVKDLLNDRHYILNQMFRLHITEREIERFHEVNAHLLELSRQLFKEHHNLVECLETNPIRVIAPNGTIEVESLLDVDEGGSLFLFDDDEDYGSNFSKIVNAMAWTEDLEIRSRNTYLGERPESDNLDDGTTWAEGCLDLPQCKDIIVCYAVHDLCTHHNYSIPDLLRLQSYIIRHNIDVVRKNTISSGVLSMISQ